MERLWPAATTSTAEVARGRGRTLWRGRDVGPRPPGRGAAARRRAPHADAVRQAAQRASAVEHPGLLRVIDTAEDDGRVFVVTRWLAGSPLSDQLASGPLAPTRPGSWSAAVAEALAAAAAEDVHHLVLDPRDVLLTDHGVVVVGIGVRAALEGVQADEDAEDVDAWRLGALLYAALTARWPGYPCAGLPGAPVVGGRVARPRQVRAGVPGDLDDDRVAGARTRTSTDPLDTPGAMGDALHEPTRRRDRAPEPRTARRTRCGAGSVCCSSWHCSRPAPCWSPGRSGRTPSGPSPAADGYQPRRRRRPAPAERPARGRTRSRSGRATAFDPAGDGSENDADAALAVDGDLATAWTTVTYASRNLGELKPGRRPAAGAGRGSRRSPGSSSGWSAAAATCRSGPRGRAPTRRALLPERPTRTTRSPATGGSAVVRGASDLVTLRFSPAVTTDRVLIWFTALPASEDGYQGGVVEATLFS